MPLKEKLKPHFEDDGKGRIKSRQDAEEIIDELFDLFLLSYDNGRKKCKCFEGANIRQSMKQEIPSFMK